ncbi:unnamed protein product [Gongylonema pulchrum]|uniref:WD_REPEATS_REGION domain-containing protein n=1 Tax=Gongylonema pulchrum TaxID=637853 RepID=A0A3P7NVF9_9BILA|nr:unnamed protein product [Gongylonema pulchrum]
MCFFRREKVYSAGNDSLLCVHDVVTRDPILRFKAEEPIYNVATNVRALASLSLREKVYSAGNDSLLCVHDVVTRDPILRFKAEEPIYNVATNPRDDAVIMSASEDRKVRLHDLRSNEDMIAVEGSEDHLSHP